MQVLLEEWNHVGLLHGLQHLVGTLVLDLSLPPSDQRVRQDNRCRQLELGLVLGLAVLASWSIADVVWGDKVVCLADKGWAVGGAGYNAGDVRDISDIDLNCERTTIEGESIVGAVSIQADILETKLIVNKPYLSNFRITR